MLNSKISESFPVLTDKEIEKAREAAENPRDVFIAGAVLTCLILLFAGLQNHDGTASVLWRGSLLVGLVTAVLFFLWRFNPTKIIVIYEFGGQSLQLTTHRWIPTMEYRLADNLTNKQFAIVFSVVSGKVRTFGLHPLTASRVERTRIVPSRLSVYRFYAGKTMTEIDLDVLGRLLERDFVGIPELEQGGVDQVIWVLEKVFAGALMPHEGFRHLDFLRLLGEQANKGKGAAFRRGLAEGQVTADFLWKSRQVEQLEDLYTAYRKFPRLSHSSPHGTEFALHLIDTIDHVSERNYYLVAKRSSDDGKAEASYIEFLEEEDRLNTQAERDKLDKQMAKLQAK